MSAELNSGAVRIHSFTRSTQARVRLDDAAGQRVLPVQQAQQRAAVPITCGVGDGCEAAAAANLLARLSTRAALALLARLRRGCGARRAVRAAVHAVAAALVFSLVVTEKAVSFTTAHAQALAVEEAGQVGCANERLECLTSGSVCPLSLMPFKLKDVKRFIAHNVLHNKERLALVQVEHLLLGVASAAGEQLFEENLSTLKSSSSFCLVKRHRRAVQSFARCSEAIGCCRR